MALIAIPYKELIVRQLFSGGVRWEQRQRERESRGLLREYRIVNAAIGKSDMKFLEDTADVLKLRGAAASAGVVIKRVGKDTLRKAATIFRMTMKLAGFIFAKVIRKHQRFPSKLFLGVAKLMPAALRTRG